MISKTKNLHKNENVKKKKAVTKDKKRKADSNEEKSDSTPEKKKMKTDSVKKKKVKKIDKVSKPQKDSTKQYNKDEMANISIKTSGGEVVKLQRPDELMASKKMQASEEECPGMIDLNEIDFDCGNTNDFGPGTLESEGEYSGDENEEDFKADKLREKTDFYDGFDNDRNRQDAWDTILDQVRGKRVRNLKETVQRVLEEHQNERGGNIGKLKKKFAANTDDEFKLRPSEEARMAKIKLQPERRRRGEGEEKDKLIFEEAIPAQEGMTFIEMNLSRPVLKAIEEMGYEAPTPIQATTIPIALQGRDICGCAATGTGKTAAFLLPIIERLLFKPKEDLAIRVLILTPTRELGLQIYEVTRELTKFTSIATAISVGGLNLNLQRTSLKKVPDIVIATPGRLIDHLANSPSFHIHDVEVLVLDEADRMLEENFESQMKKIIEQCPVNRQSMLFSATMTMQVRELALVSLKNPVKIFTNNNTDVAMNLRQEVIRIKFESYMQRDGILLYLVMRYFNQHTLVFAPTREKAHLLHIMLACFGIESGELHGDLKQAERVAALKKFKEEKIDVLVATDVAARGLDIKGIQTVINYVLPREYSRYVHRVGRTARAGRCGRSISLVAESEYKHLLRIRKNSKAPVFERVVKSEVLTNYWTKVQQIQPVIERILEEEQLEAQRRREEDHRPSDKPKEYKPKVNKQWLSELPKDVSKIGKKKMKALRMERPKMAERISKERAMLKKPPPPKKEVCSKSGRAKFRDQSLKWGHLNSVKSQNDRPSKPKKFAEEPGSRSAFAKELDSAHNKRMSFKGNSLGPAKKKKNAQKKK